MDISFLCAFMGSRSSGRSQLEVVFLSVGNQSLVDTPNPMAMYTRRVGMPFELVMALATLLNCGSMSAAADPMDLARKDLRVKLFMILWG